MFTRSIGDEQEGKMIRVGLCAGRHEIVHGDTVINDFIFPDPIENPNDFKTLREIAAEKLEQMWNHGNDIYIYVTGLSQALTVTLSEACKLATMTSPEELGWHYEDVRITLMHWDRETETYKGQLFSGR